MLCWVWVVTWVGFGVVVGAVLAVVGPFPCVSDAAIVALGLALVGAAVGGAGVFCAGSVVWRWRRLWP